MRQKSIYCVEQIFYTIYRKKVSETRTYFPQIIDKDVLFRGRTQFSVLEAATVRDKFFPGFSLEYLFTNEQTDDDQGA